MFPFILLCFVKVVFICLFIYLKHIQPWYISVAWRLMMQIIRADFCDVQYLESKIMSLFPSAVVLVFFEVTSLASPLDLLSWLDAQTHSVQSALWPHFTNCPWCLSVWWSVWPMWLLFWKPTLIAYSIFFFFNFLSKDTCQSLHARISPLPLAL